MNIRTTPATLADAAAIAALRTSVADELTRLHGRGHWSSAVTERSVLRGIETSHVLIARHGDHIVGTLRLATKKPWAIDASHFVNVRRPLYLVDMAVTPALQRQGAGRRLIEEAVSAGRIWPAEAIRLDAYDHAAGAGPFYVKCGFREVGRVVYRGTPLIYFEMLL
jgi:GNAT superfamily N-acetyltransferase